MIYPVYLRQYIDDPAIKILFVKDTDESTGHLIPVRYSKTSSYTEYKGHLYNKYGKEITLSNEIQDIVRCLGETPVYGRGDAIFLVTLKSDPNTETLACADTDLNGNTSIVVHPECENDALVTNLGIFFGENTCLESWFGKDRIGSLYLIEKPSPISYTLFDAAYNSLIPAEIYQHIDSNDPLDKGIYSFERNPYIDESQRFTISLYYHDQHCEIHTDEDFLKKRLESLKPQEIPHFIPFYLTP